MKSSRQKSESSRATLKKLLEEKRARRLREEKAGRDRPAAAATSAASPARTSSGAHQALQDSPLETWQRERRRAGRSKNLSAGQVANLLEGLTPDGRDRSGRKVSFVESDKPLRGSRRGLSGY